MIKILAVGNSFSQDATAYLHDMARFADLDSKVVNLYIGGCPLALHCQNIEANTAAYAYELNGFSLDRQVSIKRALLEEDWDFVTIQQASHDSGIWASYVPHIYTLSEYIKKYAPNCQIYIHQTWAYEIDSTHPEFARYGGSQTAMYTALKACYDKAAKELNVPILPVGEVIQELRGLHEFDYACGGQSLCRDGFHLDLMYGRYAAAAVWYETLFHGNILQNGYLPPRFAYDGAAREKIAVIRQTVHDRKA